MEFMIFVDFDLLADHAFDVAQMTNVTRFAERNRNTFGTAATGTANAVHIVFRIGRQVIVDDMRDARDVNPTRCNVSCDQDRELAITEIPQDFLANTLLLVTMDGVGINTFIAQLERKFVRIGFGFGENKYAFAFLTFQQLNQKRGLVMTFHEHATLGNTLGHAGLRRGFNLNRIVQQTVGKMFDSRRHSCREHHRLVITRQHFGNGQNIFGETHIEHTVGFIKDEDFDIVETDGVA